MGIFGSGKKKEFKRGMEAGAKPFEDKFEQIGEQVDSAKEDLSNQINSFSGIQDAILTELSNQEKKELFDLNTEKSICSLDSDDKEFSLGILYSVADLFQETSDLQKQYLIRLQRYFGITEPNQNVGLNKIENLDDLATQKALYQLVNEFVFLHDGAFHEDELDEDLYDYFSLNKKTKNTLRDGIERLTKITGYFGLIEKYGYEAVEEYLIDGATEQAEHSASLIDENLLEILRDYMTALDPEANFAIGNEIDLELAEDFKVIFDVPEDEEILCGCYDWIVTSEKIYIDGITIETISVPYKELIEIDYDDAHLFVTTESEFLKFTLFESSNIDITITDCIFWIEILSKAANGIFEYKTDLSINNNYLNRYRNELERMKSDDDINMWLDELTVYPKTSLGHRLFLMNNLNIPYDKIIAYTDDNFIFSEEKILYKFISGVNEGNTMKNIVEFDLGAISGFNVESVAKNLLSQQKLTISMIGVNNELNSCSYEGDIVSAAYLELKSLKYSISKIIRLSQEYHFKLKNDILEG